MTKKKEEDFIARYAVTATVELRVKAPSFAKASKRAQDPPCEWKNIFNEAEKDGGVISGEVTSHQLMSVRKV
jgi:hypothetical protein